MPNIDVKQRPPHTELFGATYDGYVPDKCPICHHAITPHKFPGMVFSAQDEDENAQIIEILFRCPRTDCAHIFIAQYYFVGGKFNYTRSKPQAPQKENFEEELVKLSPNFIKIYNQAIAAEAYELNEIAGVGLRKALEFLIKEYCIYKYPAKREHIEKILLGPCIKEYIDNVRIQQCAEKATWLGNDETHFVKKWKEHDVKDLKALIGLTRSWIVAELRTEKYLREMQPAQRTES